VRALSRIAKPNTLAGRALYRILRWLHPGINEQHRLSRLAGRAGYWADMQVYVFGFLTRMGLRPWHTLLDIGCGPLSGGLPLIRYLEPGRYVGVDLLEDTVAEARRQIAKHGLENRRPEVHVSRTFGRDELDGRVFDFIWASQVMYHLVPDDLRALLAQVAARLAPGGRFYGDILDQSVSTAGRYWRGFAFHVHDPEAIAAAAAGLGLAMRRLGRVEEFGFPLPGRLRLSSMLELCRDA